MRRPVLETYVVVVRAEMCAMLPQHWEGQRSSVPVQQLRLYLTRLHRGSTWLKAHMRSLMEKMDFALQDYLPGFVNATMCMKTFI